MFEHFTERSRKVMALANQQAIRHGRPVIDTEHILLGVVEEGSGVGANVLKSLMGGTLIKVRREVECLMPSGGDRVRQGKLPQTDAAKAVIMLAIEEARNLNHSHVGTEHILLATMRHADGVAGRALTNLGLNIDLVRNTVIGLLANASASRPFAENFGRKETVVAGSTPPRRKAWWRIWSLR